MNGQLLKEALIKYLSGILLVGALLFLPAGTLKWENGILLLNPGAVQDGRYAVLNISRLGAIDPELCHI